MKVVIISDIHGNFPALDALRESYDELWVLGDLVNYGPNPREVIAWVRKHAHVIVRGNHDHAIGFGVDPRCSPPYKRMAAETSAFTNSILNPEEKNYLELLPLSVERRLGPFNFYLCHAMPSDPLFGYLEAGSHRWIEEARSIRAQTLMVGHTHLPFIREIGTQRLINPGSLGQPKTETPQACYAIWQEGTSS